MTNIVLGKTENNINAVKMMHSSIYKKIMDYKYLYLMMLPGIIYYIIFKYAPMYGVLIAFKDFSIVKGILHSPWVGLKNFELIFSSSDVIRVVKNTLIISGLKLAINFPAPIIFALLLNEVGNKHIKKNLLTISSLPHFLSWVILGGVVISFLSPSTGIINVILKFLGFEPIYFIASANWFRPVLVVTSMWKEAGWGSIIYLATLSGVDTQLYEAAVVDGAGKIKQTIHITIPSILPVIMIMFIFAVGSIVNDDFDQIFNLYNPMVYRVGDVFSTYIYRIGLVNAQYSFATAAGMLKNIIAFALIITTNKISKKFSEYGIW